MTWQVISARPYHTECFDLHTFIRCNVRATRLSQRIKCHAPELHPSCHPLHTPKQPRGACDYCRSWRCTICRAPTQLADLRFDPFMAGASPSQLQDDTITRRRLV